jgi:ATP-binding cassette subfamily A (ABC1) protein 3
LYCQQFYALLVKHFYYTTRFLLGLVLSIALPLISLLVALLVIKFSNDGDIELSLTLPEQALSSNISFFWADFTSDSPVNFSASDASFINATNFFNFTSDVESIRSSVQNYTNITSCCSYQYQILDKYCASRTSAEYGIYSNGTSERICTNQEFGYARCQNCLRCCDFRMTQPNEHSCTTVTPADGTLFSYAIYLCPASPVISINERFGSSVPIGPLDDVNVYVAEKLLQVSNDLNPTVFDSRFQGGFVIHSSPKAAYEACGSEDIAETCQYLSPALASSATALSSLSFTDNMNISAIIGGVCSLFDASVPNCELLPSTQWSYNFTGLLGFCSEFYSCDYFDRGCMSAADDDCDVGKTSTPSNADSSALPTATIWYSNQAFHTLPIVVNSFYNLYIRGINSSYSISITNHPLPQRASNDVLNGTNGTRGIILTITLSFGYSFLFANFIITKVQERQENSKHLQVIGGVNRTIYWFANYTMDSVIMLLVITLSLVLFAAIQVEGISGSNLGAVFLLLLFGCWTALSTTYVFSFFFTNTLIGFTILYIVYCFVASILHFATFAMTQSNVDQNLLDATHYIFSIHPVYA